MSDEAISNRKKRLPRSFSVARNDETIMNITAKTKICMVIGDPVGHSLSPQVHNAAYDALGLDFVFVGSRVKKDNLENFIKGVRAMNIRGISVTLPHKINIMNYLDEIDESAKKIGAINTIVNNEGILKGYNTDWFGIVGPIGQKTSLNGKTVAIIGASGAARAAAYGITSKGGKLTIYNRTFEKAKILAEEFGGEAFSLGQLKKVKDADVIINTTSIGMYPNTNETPLPKEYITHQHIVMDAVYKPRKTRLLQEAKEQGATTIDGIEMFFGQAFPQFELYTGHDAPIEAMKNAVMSS